MSEDRLTVAIIYGGRSAEHEVSQRSAASVFQAMDKKRYEVIPVLIAQDGPSYRTPQDVSTFVSDQADVKDFRLILSPDPAQKIDVVVSEDQVIRIHQCAVDFIPGTSGIVQAKTPMLNDRKVETRHEP